MRYRLTLSPLWKISQFSYTKQQAQTYTEDIQKKCNTKGNNVQTCIAVHRGLTTHRFKCKYLLNLSISLICANVQATRSYTENSLIIAYICRAGTRFQEIIHREHFNNLQCNQDRCTSHPMQYQESPWLSITKRLFECPW